MSNINGPTYKVSDEEFNAMVISYKLQDGTVSLEQLQEAARNTRVPEVVLAAHRVNVEEVLGTLLNVDYSEVKVEDEIKAEAEVSNEATFKALIAAYKENDGLVTIEQLRDAAKDVIDPEYFLNEAELDYKAILGEPEVAKVPTVPPTKTEKPSIAELAAAAKLRIQAINNCQTKEEVEALLQNETAKSVLKAGAAKLELLTLNN